MSTLRVAVSDLVSPSYFRTMRIRLLAGRSFSGQDGPPATPVVIVNETMARRYWPGASPIGKRVRFNGTNDPWMEVVGAIADVKHWGLDARVNPEIYLPLKMGFGSTMTYVIDSDLVRCDRMVGPPATASSYAVA